MGYPGPGVFRPGPVSQPGGKGGFGKGAPLARPALGPGSSGAAYGGFKPAGGGGPTNAFGGPRPPSGPPPGGLIKKAFGGLVRPAAGSSVAKAWSRPALSAGAKGSGSGRHQAEASQVFVCKCCRGVEISGEQSLLEHVRGKKHKAQSGGKGFVGLLPNRWGVIPALSEYMKFQLGPGGQSQTRASSQNHHQHAGQQQQQKWQQQQQQQQQAVQKMGVCRDTERLLHRALSASSDLDQQDSGPSQSTWEQSEDPHGRQPEQGTRGGGKGPQRKTHSAGPRFPARVPPRTLGNPRLTATRESLPVFTHRADILHAIESSQVCIVEGETGCGKTTQVAQFIIEQAAERGEPCSVVCTQPRRISAIGVSERVADERGEHIGGCVGYAVRMESKASAATCLLFCTTGVLLRRLENDPDLEHCTHVVVDEVHERGVESDFLLLALRNLCHRRPSLRVILMSATMDKDLFGRYFGNAPSLTVPGRTFPVQTYFLEEALLATGHRLNPSADWAIGGGKGGGKGKGKDDAGKGDVDAAKKEDLSMTAVSRRYARFGHQVQAVLQRIEQDEVNYDLLMELLQDNALQNLDKEGDGANGDPDAPKRPSGILIFLSGAKEIERAQEALLQIEEFRQEPARSWILPLHGSLPADDQRKVFERPPPGVRKVVLSTNVAETSVTIDDIGYVLDTGRMKEMRYDAVRRMSSLEDTVVSQTNARQRRGRAGRVAPGLAVHLGLTRHRHDQLIDDHQPPEVQRVPLEQLVLRIHATRLHEQARTGKAKTVCEQLLEPPAPAAVDKAVEQLVRLGAIDVDQQGRESLTALGGHLANLPLQAQLGKLVLLGAAFGPGATDAALTVAASLQSRNPFVAPLEKREEANKARRRFAEKVAGGAVGPSDHLAVLEAYQEWNALPANGSTRFDFCQENFLSIKTLQGMAELKRQLLETLSVAGFVPPGLKSKQIGYQGRAYNGSDGVLLALAGGERTEPAPPALLAALLCAALFPQVVTATNPPKPKAKTWKQQLKQKEQQGGKEKPKLRVRDADTGEPVKVKMHPSSVSVEETSLSSPYLVYQELVNTTQLYVRDITPVPPLALVLFGGTLDRGARSQAPGDAVLTVDGWIKLGVPARVREPLLETRRRLDAHLASWVDRTGADRAKQNRGAELLDAIVQLLCIQTECEATAPEPPAPAKKAWAAQGKKKGWAKPGAFAHFGGAAAQGKKRPAPAPKQQARPRPSGAQGQYASFGGAGGGHKRAAPAAPSSVPLAFKRRKM